MASFRDRYLKGKTTTARKTTPARTINRDAMREPTPSRSVSQRSEDARRAEETYVFDEPAAFGEGMESVVVSPTEEQGVTTQMSSTPGYMESVVGEEYDPRFLAESTTALGRQQESDDIQTILNKSIAEIQSITPAYEQAKSRYEEAVEAGRKFAAGDTSLATLRLRDELASRKAIFEKEEAIYSSKVRLKENLEKALALATTAVEAKSIIEQRLNEQQRKRDRNTADRNAIENAIKSIETQRKYTGVLHLDPTGTPTDDVRLIRKEQSLNQTRQQLLDESTNISNETNRLTSMLSALTGGEATDIIQPLGPDEKESFGYERTEEQEERLRKLNEYEPDLEAAKARLEAKEDDVPPVVDSGDTGQSQSVTNPLDPLLVQGMREQVALMQNQ